MIEPTKGEFQIPVLSKKRPRGYRNDLFLDADYTLEDCDGPYMSRIIVRPSLEPCFLRTLIEDGKASVCLNLSQRSYRTSYTLNLNEANIIDLDTKDFMPGERIDLLPIIVANEDLELPFIDGEMAPRYRYLNPPFHAKRGFILGYGQSKSYPLSGTASISSFFSIGQMDENEEKKEPFILDLQSDQITIKMRAEEYKLWIKVSENNSLLNDYSLLNASIGFPAVYQVLLTIFNREERIIYRSKPWYGSLTGLLQQKLNQEPDTFLSYSTPKDLREKAWCYTGIVLDGLLKQAFLDLTQKGRANK